MIIQNWENNRISVCCQLMLQINKCTLSNHMTFLDSKQNKKNIRNSQKQISEYNLPIFLLTFQLTFQRMLQTKINTQESEIKETTAIYHQ
jgi:hypothetical protein